ncbi:sensor histidine kinase [Streptacidiphilus monticola]
MITGFAGQAALALQLAEHRRESEQLLVMDDRDRIARDLHDLAIQRLFASGLSLQAVLGRIADRPETAQRVERVVDDLDETIKTIRATIYSLHQRDRAPGATTLRARLLAETDQAAEGLGCTPALRMTGLLDTLVPDDLADDLLAVLREALSNAARHAHATAVDVTVDVSADTVRLSVTDNGRGIDPGSTRRSGLDNLRARAEQRGGTFATHPHDPSGTRLEWTAPSPSRHSACRQRPEHAALERSGVPATPGSRTPPTGLPPRTELRRGAGGAGGRTRSDEAGALACARS